MIYSIQCSGQMCNRIVWFVHTLATAIDLEANIVHPFGREIRSFSNLHPEAIPEIKVRCFDWPRFIPVDVLHGWMLRLPGMRQEYYDGNAARCREWREKGKKSLLLWNWHFRNDEAIARHREKIVAYLRAKDGHCVRPGRIVAGLRDPGVTLVGVHIRRGDYREAAPGWCYDDATYLRLMEECEAALGGNVRFALVSNEPVNLPFFTNNGINAVDASGGRCEDLLTLSLCDFIIGPPSSFSWWAAYYGDKPRLSVRSRDGHVSAGGFAKVTEAVRGVVS